MDSRDRNADMARLADMFFKNLVRETYCEYGGWGLDDKRPFGNSSVEYDILKGLGIKPAGEDGYTEEQEEYANELYRDLGAWLKDFWEQHKTQSA